MQLAHVDQRDRAVIDEQNFLSDGSEVAIGEVEPVGGAAEANGIVGVAPGAGREGEGGEWVAVSDDVPIDEHRRDELLERLQARAGGGAPAADDEDEEDDPDFASAGFEESDSLD